MNYRVNTHLAWDNNPLTITDATGMGPEDELFNEVEEVLWDWLKESDLWKRFAGEGAKEGGQAWASRAGKAFADKFSKEIYDKINDELVKRGKKKLSRALLRKFLISIITKKLVRTTFAKYFYRGIYRSFFGGKGNPWITGALLVWSVYETYTAVTQVVQASEVLNKIPEPPEEPKDDKCCPKTPKGSPRPELPCCPPKTGQPKVDTKGRELCYDENGSLTDYTPQGQNRL